MKKLTFYTSIILIHTISYGYNIEVQINGLKNSKIILARYLGERNIIIDSTKLDINGNGRFIKEGQLSSGIYLFILDINHFFEVLIEDDNEFIVETDTTDLFFRLEISGADISEAFLLHQKNIIKKQKLNAILHGTLNRMDINDRRRDDIEKKIEELKKETDNLNQLFLIENMGTFAAKVVKATIPIDIPDFSIPDNVINKDSMHWILSLHYYKNHFFDNIDLHDNRFIYTPLLYSKLNSYFNQVLYQLPDSIISGVDFIFSTLEPGSEIKNYILGFLLTNYNNDDKIGFEDVLLHVIEKYVHDIKAVYADYKVLNDVIFKTNYLKKTAIGQIAPDLEVNTLTGNTIKLLEIDAKYIILLFWNPNCPHCEAELEYLIDFYNKYRFLGVEILAVCTGHDTELWQKSVSEKNMTWINAIDTDNSSKFRELYQVFFTPKMYLLDENKKILLKSNEVVDIEKEINKKM